MQDNILFWQARIRITQAPIPIEPITILENEVPKYQDPVKFRSFLNDPFGNNPSRTYGLEITANDKIDFVFFTKTESKDEAIELGHAWLTDLKHEFLGLDGVVEVRAITIDYNNGGKWDKLEEIILPRGIFKQRLNIIERFISAFYYNRRHEVQLILLWKRKSLEKNTIEPITDIYSLKIFVSHDTKIINKERRLKLKGILRFIFMDIENRQGNRVIVETPSVITRLNVIKGNVFKYKGEPANVTKESVNFDFPEHLPLPRMPILENENVRYIDLSEDFKKLALKIGYHVKNGVITDHVTYLPINKLPQDMAIFGKSGSGKTYFLVQFMKELLKKAKDIGILILNVAKASQEIYYKDFKIMKYSDDEFRVPYFIKGEEHSIEKYLQETATYICASLGLKNVFEKIIYRSEVGLMEINGKLPEFFNDLLRAVENYMNKNKYGPEEQANLMRVFRNRMNVFDEEKIQNVLKLSKELPKWIIHWMNGENIFLDLSMCSKFIKLLIVNAIFQLIRTLTKDIEAEELKHLIVIDEAHAILEKPITTNSDDADFIMKEQMAKIFSELLKEYRSRGVGFIIADQSPMSLFDDVASQPSIKVIFRVDHPNNLLFSEDVKERQILTQLENRIALVISGATGEKYLIKTLDFTRF
ncbi:MAG: ATP-binding protein [Promethearchaeota archaeon]